MRLVFVIIVIMGQKTSKQAKTKSTEIIEAHQEPNPTCPIIKKEPPDDTEQQNMLQDDKIEEMYEEKFNEGIIN